MSELALKLIREAKEKRLIKLDLGNCGLTDLPDELFELTWLEELILSNGGYYEYSFETLDKKSFKSQNKGDDNYFNFINQKLSTLGDLRKIQIGGGSLYSRFGFDDLNPLKSLHKLQLLNISFSEVRDLSPLKNLKYLKVLDIEGAKIKSLSTISEMRNFLIIHANGCEILDIPLKFWNGGSKVDLSSFNFAKENKKSEAVLRIKEVLKKKSEFLDLRNCGLDEIPEELYECYWLKSLSFNNYKNSRFNRLDEALDADVGYYSTYTKTKSERSDLVEFPNSIKHISDNISNLINLIDLDLSGNPIIEISPFIIELKNLISNEIQIEQLKNLKSLAVKNQKYKEAADFRELEYKLIMQGRFLFDSDNLKSPSQEIIDLGFEAIVRYWTEAARGGKQKVNEARLLLVGQGGSGKTTLKDKLRNRKAQMPEPDETTIGINIENLKSKNQDGEEFNIQIWDFGGQNIQKYAHQFFMTDSVVYAVLSNTREQNSNFQYWLNIIELLGKDAPFIIVQNEKDGHSENLKDITQIQERFPKTFKSVEQVNLKNAETDPRFEILEKKLLFEATQLPHTQNEYLTSFVNIRKQVEILSETKQTITFKEFKNLCKAEGIEDVELMNDYARTFTYLGIALHFDDDIHLKNQVFLRPKWIIDALFAVLYSPIVEEQNGKFSETDSESIWEDDQYDEMHGILLQLMVRFQLCYPILNSKDFIVPQRLPSRLEPFIPTSNSTNILYRYRFLPSGILTQLTCRLHSLIETDKVWNDAVQFVSKTKNGRVFVRENSASNSIEIFGFGNDKAELISTVVDTIDDIHLKSKFGNLKFEKLVPCPCQVCSENRSKKESVEFFNYDFLLELLSEGETESDRCKLSKKKFPIRDILKHSSIRVFKIENIKTLLIDDRIEEAIKLLRSQFADDNEVIIQLSRLTRNSRQDRMGQINPIDSNVEKNKIIKGVLEMLTEWEKENC